MRKKMKLTPIEILVETIGSGSILTIWIVTLFYYFNMPQIIPIHYNAGGQIDGYGEKYHILILNLILSLIYIGINLVNKKPHYFNYSKSKFEEHRNKKYPDSKETLNLAKIVIVAFFGYFSLKTIYISIQDIEVSNFWFVFTMSALVAYCGVYFLFKSFKMK